MSVPSGTGGANRYMALPDVAGNYASAPDRPAGSVTGDIDIRVKLRPNGPWGSGVDRRLIGQYSGGSGGGSRAWTMGLKGDGEIFIGTSYDGFDERWRDTNGSMVPFVDGATGWVRATVDIDNGAAQSVARFYTSSDGSSWAQLGGDIFRPTGGPFDSTAPIEVGSNELGSYGYDNQRIYSAEVRNGIDGPAVIKFDPMEATAAAAAAGSWTSSVGDSWTVNRVGGNLPVDIASELSAANVSGLPTNGAADYRFIDGVATYKFASTSTPSGTAITVSLGDFVNTATPGNYASTITTYNGAGPPPAAVDSVTTGTFTFTDATVNSTVSTVVDPSLTFSVVGRGSVCNGQSATNFQTATGTAVSLGRLSAFNIGGGAQDLSVSTNAAYGFVVYVRTPGTTPNSLRDAASHSIADVSGTNASPGSAPLAGTAGFGYTSSDTSTPFTSNTWAKLTNTNDSVMIGSGGTFSKSSCVGFQAAVSSTTSAGSYSANVVYTAVPAF